MAPPPHNAPGPAPAPTTNRGLAVVVMGKAPVPGKVKTRLTKGPGALTPQAAAAVAAAMMRATLERVAAHTRADRHILAMDRPELAPDWAGPMGWTIVDQGEGSLGDRMARMWDQAGPGPVAFFGVDCPDVPADALTAVGPAVARAGVGADAAVGPVDDGGYWTLAAGQPRPELLRGIDWGSDAVYDQTHAVARDAGLRLHDLPTWHDVDLPQELQALRLRLNKTAAQEPALARLADALAPHALG